MWVFELASGFSSVSPFDTAVPATSFDTQRFASTNDESGDLSSSTTFGRRSVLWSGFTAAAATAFPSAVVASDDYESVAARAAALAKKVQEEESFGSPTTVEPVVADDRTAYDFSLPVKGEQVKFFDLVRQEKLGGAVGDDGKEIVSGGGVKVKAVLVVNMKQDDPIARKNIPELISLAAKYGPGGFAVVCLPTDQGYYEPDTSALLRLKMAQEYGYGINPATALTDKVNILGSGAHPFMRWIQNRCRTPSGLGRIQGNFEKFLVDGKTGLPLRRYPRKYDPYDITSDIEALLNDQRLPPASGNFNEQWRGANYDAKLDTYRFQKGLNYFDQ